MNFSTLKIHHSQRILCVIAVICCCFAFSACGNSGAARGARTGAAAGAAGGLIWGIIDGDVIGSMAAGAAVGAASGGTAGYISERQGRNR